jgi:hypothetical protein
MAQLTTPPPPIEISLTGLFEAIGPVRWGVALLGLMLSCITLSGLIFLTMPHSKRKELAASLISMKEWNTVLSTLCTILGPVGTYIGMIGALTAMHQVAIAADSAARLAAQALFFKQAAQMFISSLAGIGVGISLGMVNNLILHHVLPDHAHPVEDEGMIASSLAILRRPFKNRAPKNDDWQTADQEQAKTPRLLPPPTYRELANEN